MHTHTANIHSHTRLSDTTYTELWRRWVTFGFRGARKLRTEIDFISPCVSFQCVSRDFCMRGQHTHTLTQKQSGAKRTVTHLHIMLGVCQVFCALHVQTASAATSCKHFDAHGTVRRDGLNFFVDMHSFWERWEGSCHVYLYLYCVCVCDSMSGVIVRNKRTIAPLHNAAMWNDLFHFGFIWMYWRT